MKKISSIVNFQSHRLVDGSVHITGIVQAGARVDVSAGVVKHSDQWESDAKSDIVALIWRELYGDVYRRIDDLRRAAIAMPPVGGYAEQNEIVTRCTAVLAALDALR